MDHLADTWVQCEKVACLKWRRVSTKDVQHLSHQDPWFCEMNKDPAYNTCAAEQEDYKFYEELAKTVRLQYVESVLEPGTLVWAKMQGYCRWPGMITRDPEKQYHVITDGDGHAFWYHVEFLGSMHSHSWMKFKYVENFGSCTSKEDKKRLYEKIVCPAGEQGKPTTKRKRGRKKKSLPAVCMAAGSKEKKNYHSSTVESAIDEALDLANLSLSERLGLSHFKGCGEAPKEVSHTTTYQDIPASILMDRTKQLFHNELSTRQSLQQRTVKRQKTMEEPVASQQCNLEKSLESSTVKKREILNNLESGKVQKPDEIRKNLESGKVQNPSRNQNILESGKVKKTDSIQKNLESGKVQKPDSIQKTLEGSKVQNPARIQKTLESSKVQYPARIQKSLESGKVQKPDRIQKTLLSGKVQKPHRFKKTLENSKVQKPDSIEKTEIGKVQKPDQLKQISGSSLFQKPDNLQKTLEISKFQEPVKTSGKKLEHKKIEHNKKIQHFLQSVKAGKITRKSFQKTLRRFMDGHAMIVKESVRWYNKVVTTFQIFCEILQWGGFDEVNEDKKWLTIFRKLSGAGQKCSSGNSLKTFYYRNLLPYERFLTVNASVTSNDNVQIIESRQPDIKSVGMEDKSNETCGRKSMKPTDQHVIHEQPLFLSPDEHQDDADCPTDFSDIKFHFYETEENNMETVTMTTDSTLTFHQETHQHPAVKQCQNTQNLKDLINSSWLESEEISFCSPPTTFEEQSPLELCSSGNSLSLESAAVGATSFQLSNYPSKLLNFNEAALPTADYSWGFASTKTANAHLCSPYQPQNDNVEDVLAILNDFQYEFESEFFEQ